MTAPELRAIGVSLYGSEWQSALARAINISPRHMRRLATGEVSISDSIEHDIRLTTGGLDLERLGWPRDEWILGDGGGEEGREYIIHAARPRFIARIVEADEDGECDEEADLSGITYSSGDTMLCEIVWIDPAPPEQPLRELLSRAAAHIAAETPD